jgi:hypothetical protein
MVADHDEPAFRGDIDLLRGDWRSQHDGLERKREVLLDGRVKSDGLLGFAVRIDDGFLDQGIETCCRDPGRRGRLPCLEVPLVMPRHVPSLQHAAPSLAEL